MINTMFVGTNKLLILLLICFHLIGCSASQHAGITYKKKPPMTETNEEVWFEYWEDQFDARRGKVIAPPKQHPPESHSAYIRASQNWEIKVEDAKTKTYTAIFGTLIAISFVSFIIAFSSAPDTDPYPKY